MPSLLVVCHLSIGSVWYIPNFPGFAHELANYGEYSGAPTEGQTYEYAKTIIDLITRGAPRAEGKILIIGGGIANFTNVAATFKGIIRALKEFKQQLIKSGVKIFVRRGGPNYQVCD
jgi:ATP citrate (pro-S)-lyase